MANIQYTIADNKLEEFKVGFLKLYPVPTETDEEGVTTPTMSDNKWIKERGKQWFIDSYKRGKSVLHKETEGAYEDLVT